MEDPQIDEDRIDEAVLALMFLDLHKERDIVPDSPLWWTWKSFNWDAMGRLHAKDLIYNPVGKAKSVVLTAEGRKQCEEAFYRLFARRP
jgi:hypothetical protein